MDVLIIGGTGLISVGIIKHLLARKAHVTMYNRGERERTVPAEVSLIQGDRNQVDAFVATFSARRFDVVIDMICFTPAQAEATLRAFSGRCEQLIFCSTVCTYGTKVPHQVLIDERFPQEPISQYGRDKVACELAFRRAHDQKRFKATIVRPSHTYGPGSPLIDQLEFDAWSWSRMESRLPVLVADGGLGLWQSTHRDDCGKLFAYAALNPATYGQDYNATRDEVLTWSGYYQVVAGALGVKDPQILSLPADRIIRRDPGRFGLLREITRFHGAYSSAKAKSHVPEFQCTISLHAGALDTFADQRRRKAWRPREADALYDALVAEAASLA
jgi:nucleoside-diphosphate-sugar epimerase